MKTLTSNGQTNGTIGAKSICQSPSNCGTLQPVCFTPFHKEFGLIECCNVVITSSIARLLLLGSPFNITHFVMSIIINAINRVRSRWSFTNDVSKFFKRLKTKFYPPLSIIFISWIQRIATSAFGITKNAIQQSLRLSVGGVSYNSYFPFSTSARSCVRSPQKVSGNNFPFTTIAFTKPLSLLTFQRIASKPDYVQFTKSLITQIYGFGIGIAFGTLKNRFHIKASPLVLMSSRVVEGLSFLRPASAIIT